MFLTAHMSRYLPTFLAEFGKRSSTQNDALVLVFETLDDVESPNLRSLE
jgi:hypothetical protein